jgi:hypothetical protein
MKTETKNGLPGNYWEIIENFLPNYYSRNDVLLNDRMNCYLEGMELSEEDLDWIRETIEELHLTKEAVQKGLDKLDAELYNEALENMNK